MSKLAGSPQQRPTVSNQHEQRPTISWQSPFFLAPSFLLLKGITREARHSKATPGVRGTANASSRRFKAESLHMKALFQLLY